MAKVYVDIEHIAALEALIEQLLEACEEAYKNEFGLPSDTIKKLYAAIVAAKGGE